MTPAIPKVFAHWETFVEWLLARTEKFPKRVAMTFRTRLDNLALEVVERLVEARFSKDKMPLLIQINLALEKMRLLLRLCFKQRLLDEKAYLFACEQIDTCGRMIGGWLRQQRSLPA